MHPLFRVYPSLERHFPRVPLGKYPTSVERLTGLEKRLGHAGIFVKREDRSSPLYGGNKVRSLEFILGDVLRKKRKTLLTFGLAGSNHTLAVSIFGRSLGLHPVCVHVPQPVTAQLRKNLLYQLVLGTEFHHYNSVAAVYPGALLRCGINIPKQGRPPYIIMPGGSCTLGATSTAGAGFELAEQVDTGHIPEPDVIVIPLNSCGTTAGLCLGLRVAGLKTRVLAVAVGPPHSTNFNRIKKYHDRSSALLHRLEPDFPRLVLREDDLDITFEYLGEGEGWYTEEGRAAAGLLEGTDNLYLDNTYTAKAMAALIDFCSDPRNAGKTVLFWNTFSTVDFDEKIEGVSYTALPKPYHLYFERPCQGERYYEA